MPQIGWFELLVIIIVAILVIGLKDFPIVLKKIGTWVGSIKRYVNNIQSQVTEVSNIDINEEKDLKEDIKTKNNNDKNV